jgi:hypothetical protein
MVYLIRDEEIAASENEAGARTLEAQGFHRVSEQEHRAAWQEKANHEQARVREMDRGEREHD